MADLPTGTVTFLFTDIEGSTRLLGQLGDRYPEILEQHQRLLRAAFESNGGVEVSTEGDSFFIVFPAASGAVRAAIDLQRSLAAHPWPEDGRVRVRVGMHTGEGTLGADNYVGVDLHRAARVAAAGHGGQVLLSASTRALVEHAIPEGVALRDLGEHRLKDLAHPEKVSQIVIPGLPADFPPIKTVDARRGNLPRQLTSFIGRARELREVKELLRTARLVTLLGPGGAGKTRLSLQVGVKMEERFEDGVFFVPLAPIADPDLLAPSIAGVLGVPEDRSSTPTEMLIEHLRTRECLLVLDNFEQVTGGAPVVGEILGATEHLRILATSREPLSLVGEHEYVVPPLGLPDPENLPDLATLSQFEAVQLFVERATTVKPGFSVTNENAPAVAQICARLDGLPLAIELAAARVKLLSPEAIMKRLEHRLELLAGGARDLPQRQQTLRGAIAWSYDLLEEHERSFFARLAVFLGGFTLEAAETICNQDGELGIDTLDGVASLVNKSLIRQMVLGDAEDRFLMLQTIRDFALERYTELEEREQIRARHASYFLELAQRVRPLLLGAEQSRWLDALEEEHDNLRAAIEGAIRAGDGETAGRLAGALWRFWQMRGHLREGSDRLAQVLACPGIDEHPEAHADTLEAAGGVAYWTGELQDASRFYAAALELRRAHGSSREIAEAAYNLACVHVFFEETRDPELADPLLDEALRRFRELGDDAGVANVLWAGSGREFTTAALTGGPPRPEMLEAEMIELREALELYRKVGDRFGEGWTLHMVGLCLALLERFEEAHLALDEALAIFLDAGDSSAIPVMLGDYGVLATVKGDGEHAHLFAGAMDATGRETGVGLAGWVTQVPSLLARRAELLPPAEAERAYAAGERLGADEAVGLARRWSKESRES